MPCWKNLTSCKTDIINQFDSYKEFQVLGYCSLVFFDQDYPPGKCLSRKHGNQSCPKTAICRQLDQRIVSGFNHMEKKF